MKLLNHQISPAPLKVWVIFGGFVTGKTTAIVEHLVHHPEKSVFVGTPNDYVLFDIAMHNHGVDAGLGMSFYNIANNLEKQICDTEDCDLIIVENLTYLNYSNFYRLYCLNFRKKFIITTNSADVLNKLVKSGIPGMDISVAQCRTFIRWDSPEVAQFRHVAEK